MKLGLKKTLSTILAIVMVISLIPASALAVTLDEFSMTSPTVTVDGINATTATVDIVVNKNCYIFTLMGTMPTSLAGGKIVMTSMSWPINNAGSLDYTDIGSGKFKYSNAADGYEFNSGDAVITVVYSVAADTPAGTYTVDLTGFEAEDDDGSFSNKSKSTTITVQEPAAVVVPDYELYYTVDKNVDSEPDQYIEYDVGDDVVVSVYVKAKTAIELQAFDLTITNDSNLTFKSYQLPDGTNYFGTRIADSTATSQHIQAVGYDQNNNPIGLDLAAGVGTKIAEITFTVASTAVYNIGMPITITDASNIAVAGTPASFTPDRQTTGSTLLGVETKKTYTVTYDENKPEAASSLTVGGMSTPNPDTKQHNKDYTVFAAPTLDNYTFDGWNTAADGSGDPYAAGGSYTANADVTLFAQWTPDTHKVEWKSQDGSSILETDAAVAYGATLSFDGTEPTKAATAQYTYTFAGWSTSQNAEIGAAADTFTMGDADMVLYAAFSKTTNNHTVTWKSQDGNTTYETDTDVPYGTAPSFDQADPTKASDATYDYTFAGWALDADAESGTLEANLDPVEGNIDYYAAFSKEYIDYTVSYALGDHPATGATAPADDTAHNGDTVTLPAGPAAADGYTFTGWSDGTDTYDAGDPYVISGAGATFTAQYSENHYNVVYDANGGTGTLPANHTNVAYTDTITIGSGENLTRDGYTFAGWKTEADSTSAAYSAGASASKLSATDGATVTLYAHWTTDAYTITYDYTWEESATPPPVSYNVEDLPIDLDGYTTPTREGYDFNGYTIELAVAGTGNLVLDGNKIDEGTWGNLKVTTNWTPAEVNYTVNHYQENLDGTYPATPTETETEQGYTEANTAAVGKTYEHFTAGHTTGDEAGTITQVEIAADGSTVVNIYYERETYTVTYSYTGNAPSGATTPVDENSPYKYGAPVTVKNAPDAVSGYTFGGWSQTGTFVIDADTEITGNWTLNTYHIYFEDDQGNVVTDGDQTFDAENTSITEPAVPAKTDNADWYDGGAWGSYSTSTLADQHVQPTYNELTFTVTYQDENGNPYTSTDQEYTYSDRTVTKPTTVPTKDGYTVTWPDPDTSTYGDKTVTATYTPIEYTITFVLDGGTDIAVDATNGITAVNTMTYTIESTSTLPTADGKTNFSFVNWKVTATDTEASWASNSTVNGGTPVNGKYGNVTLTAQWAQALNYEVQEYKYAPTGYKLLIIAPSNADDAYKYNGVNMYYTTDANYQIGGSTGVFYTLIEANALTLTDAQVGLISTGGDKENVITYNGDVNGDGTVNIADANAIFQMVVATGSYYSIDQLTIAQRLAADMVKATDNAEYRGSIEDVNAVVAMINGTT